MPTLLTAKVLGERALATMGAFPTSQEHADPGELKRAVQWLEMVLNSQTGKRAMAGFWNIVDIPLEAGIGDYLLNDFVDEGGAQHVFSISMFDASNGEPSPLDMMYESEAVGEDLTNISTPCRAVVTRDINPVLKVFPTPSQSDEDAGQTLRVRYQSYHKPIDQRGTADTDVLLRPSWYLWAVKRLAYEIGLGPVRTLPDGELKRLKEDADMLESTLLAGDGQYNSGKPPVTEPMPGSLI